ncbi:hypothetical protein LPZ50_23970, partial [Bordetella petrii]|nr:hypothetical protein [Bordetella petrii]
MTRRRNPALPLAAQAWRMIVCLAIVALFCRAAIPAGYMPGPSATRSGQVALTLCTGSGPATSLLLDVPGKPAGPASDHANGALDCPFGVLASQALLPGLAP